METHVINVCSRPEVGKGAARRLRRSGRIPAIAYSKGEAPVQLGLSPKELLLCLRKTGRNSLFELNFDGEQESLNVMIKDSQRHPVTDNFIHIDFVKIAFDETVTVKVNVNYIGRPVGVRRGGKIEIRHRKATITALPHQIPLSIDADVTDLDIGDVLRVGALPLPEGVSVSEEDKNIPLYLVPMTKNIEGEEE